MDIKKIKEGMFDWMQKYVETSANDQTKFVIGVSGGKDSTCLAYALVEKFGKDRVIGVLMPNGVQSDISDSYKVAEALGINYVVVNIGDTYGELTTEIEKALANSAGLYDADILSTRYTTNTPARIRMTTLYGVAAAVGNCRVVNTCNLSEDLCGYSTLYGDSAGDFAPLAHLFVDEVMALCDELGVPKELGHKTPSDGMCGKSDEDNLGFTYDNLKKVATGDTKDLPADLIDMISKRIKSFAWKREIQNIPAYIPFERNPSIW